MVDTMPDYRSEPRNLRPHAEASLAMVLWGEEYSQQRLGCMDWWDSLPEARRDLVRLALDYAADKPREVVN